MSDKQPDPGPLDPRQRYVHPYEVVQAHLDNRQAQIHTSLPGTIVSYDPKTQTAVVQPAIQAMRRQLDRTRKPVDIQPIADVPVHFPSGGGHTMTFPVAKGDECMIVFQERSIDNWHQHGGQQQPSDLRMHDINDAIVHVGLRSQPKVPQNISPNTVQIRSDDGTSFIELDGKGNKVTIKTSTEVTIDCPKLTVTGAIECKGEITAKFGGGQSVTLTQHRHTVGEPPPIGGT